MACESRSQRNTTEVRRAALVACEAMERRILMCSLPHDLLMPAPAWSDAIEQQVASQQDGGPESTSLFWVNRGMASDNPATI